MVTASASLAATTFASASSSTPTTARTNARMGKYGVELSYSSQRARMIRKSRARAMTSSSSRDLPTPGSPEISTVQPVPNRTCSSKPAMVASSVSRPTSGSWPRSACLTPIGWPRIDARTGSDLPLAANGGIGVASKMVREWSRTMSVARIWPASALLITRAAVLIASPKTRYARR